MNIKNYIETAKEISKKHYGFVDNNFITLGLYQLIQNTALKETYGDLKLHQHADSSLSLKRLLNYKIHPEYQLIHFNGNQFMINHEDIDKSTFSNAIHSQNDRELLERFNDIVQDMDDFYDLKTEFSDIEISKSVNNLGLLLSHTWIFHTLIQSEYDSELNEYGFINSAPLVQLSKFKDLLNNPTVKSNVYEDASLNIIRELQDFSFRYSYPIANQSLLDFFEGDSLNKILAVDGFLHLRDHSYEELLTLAQNNPTFENTLLGKMLTSSDHKEIVMAFYNSFELTSVKTQVELFTDKVTSAPVLEEILNEEITRKAIFELSETLSNKYPIIDYTVHDIEIIQNKELDINGYNDSITNYTDSFYLMLDKIDIQELAAGWSSAIESYMINFGIYADKEELKFNDETLFFISKNQFNADMFVKCELYEDNQTKELGINSIIAKASADPSNIKATFKAIFDYAAKNEMLVDFKLKIKNEIGNMNRTNLLSIMRDAMLDYKDSVLFSKSIDKEVSNNRYYLIDGPLNSIGSKLSYRERILLQKELERFVDNAGNDSIDFDLECKIEQLCYKATQEKLKNKI